MQLYIFHEHLPFLLAECACLCTATSKPTHKSYHVTHHFPCTPVCPCLAHKKQASLPAQQPKEPPMSHRARRSEATVGLHAHTTSATFRRKHAQILSQWRHLSEVVCAGWRGSRSSHLR
jgi:hypothetical protein